MPKIKTGINRSFGESARRNNRLAGGDQSKLRRAARAGNRPGNAEILKEGRASRLYKKETAKRLAVAESEYTDRSTKLAKIRQANRNRRRLSKVMSEDMANKTKAWAKQDSLYSKMGSPTNKVDRTSLVKRIAAAGRGLFKSPVSPAAVTFEIGMDAMKKRKAAKQGRKVDRKLGSKKAI